MTLQPIDALVATLPRAEPATSEPAMVRSEPRRDVSTTLPSRQPRLTPAVAGNTTGLQLPSAAGGVTVAARRLEALKWMREAAERDMGENYQAVASHFEAEIADAQALIESVKT